MPQVTLSDAVLAEIWKRASPRPFENPTPEAALRSIFKMASANSDVSPAQSQDAGTADLAGPTHPPRAGKAPKADLQQLIRAGLIRNGETLYLVDYQRKRVPSVEATITGSLLSHGGHHATMSNLAQRLLAKVGYESQAVRGPAHWVNSKGRSVMQLWQEHLDRGR